ncbi:uncharacterized protein LOC132191633 [Corylus avellana]|uniref:uncharacterized protein LOC132191633 n=1 Tax=Corylus avellana TaxID=13451 RepID=UPI00286CFD48|nr:uncharacterized protein LOC132191633 [Corylus avellana]
MQKKTFSKRRFSLSVYTACVCVSLSPSQNSQCTEARSSTSTSIDLSHLLKRAYRQTHRNAGLCPTARGLRRRARLSGLLRPSAHPSPPGEGLSFDSPGRARPPQSAGPSQARPILARRGQRRCRLLRPRLLRSLLRRVRLVQLNFFDAASSSTAAVVPCSDRICTSALQTAATQCSPQSNQCSYSFQYGDGSGTSGYYVSDALYFDMVLGQSLIANSSAPIVFGCSTYQSGDLTKTDKAVDGIFGFRQGDLSVISQLSSRDITPQVFSHCLKGGGNGGGILVLGEILEPGTFTPQVFECIFQQAIRRDTI